MRDHNQDKTWSRLADAYERSVLDASDDEVLAAPDSASLAASARALIRRAVQSSGAGVPVPGRRPPVRGGHNIVAARRLAQSSQPERLRASFSAKSVRIDDEDDDESS